MQCETCGKDVKVGKKVMLEGSVIFTCDACAKYGKIINDVRPVEKVKKPNLQAPKEVQRQYSPNSGAEEIDALVENFHDVIKAAREKHGWKQEDLAKKINEPVSLIHRLETEAHFEPSDDLIRRLQKILGIKLMEKVKAVNLDNMKTGFKGNAKDLTLGDVVVVKKRK